MPRSAIRLRTLTSADVPFAMRLKQAAGWNQTEADWNRFLELEPDGCFLAEYEGEPAATATALAYGQRFGWIGMMLVDPNRRRLGIASAMMQHAMRYLSGCRVETLKLDATPAGKTVYDQLGFQEEYRIERRMGVASSVDSQATGCSPILPRDLDAIAEFDAAFFGADRRQVLATLLRDSPELCFQADGGFVLGRHRSITPQIGPLVARDTGVAERLLLAALGAIGNGPVLLDVPMCHPGAVSLSDRFGFVKQRELIRQYRGPNRFPGNPQGVFAIAGPELG